MRDKRAIRREIRLLTQQLSDERKRCEAIAVTLKLENIIQEKQPAVVAAFMPLPDEIAIDIERLSRLCRLVIPRITTDKEACEMEFFDYSRSTTRQGAYGIDEPQSGEAVDVGAIDMIIMPAVAFTPQGDRLGRGKGFYDRYLSRQGFRAKCIGVCFGHQLLDHIPTEPHDRRVDMVITAEDR